MFSEKIIFEEQEGVIIVPFKCDYLKKSGIWALYGKENGSDEYKCLNVGKSTEIGEEILVDLARYHYLPFREDGTEEYYNQFEEYCGFKYIKDQAQDYLYPFIKQTYSCIKFIFISNKNDLATEREYAENNNALFWRNGGSFGIERKTNWARKDLNMIGSYFPNGGEIYSTEELINKIENDLGFDKTRAKTLITQSENLGIIYYMGENNYTR